MINNYSQEEINQILLSKTLNEFYLAVIENRGELLTDDEYEKLTRRSDIVYTDATKEDIDSLSKIFQANEKLKGFAPDLMKMVYSLARIRHIGILTMIDDEVYDIANVEFVDLKRNKIDHYDNFTNYYDETNARLRFFTPEEGPNIKQNTVLVDVDDLTAYLAYQNNHVNQEYAEDLTSKFLSEVKGKPYTLKRKNLYL